MGDLAGQDLYDVVSPYELSNVILQIASTFTTMVTMLPMILKSFCCGNIES